MSNTREHGGEPAGNEPQYAPLLQLLGLRADDDLNYVTDDDVRAALPIGSTLQQRVDYVRMLHDKQAAMKAQRARSSTTTTLGSVASSVLASAVLSSEETDGKALAGVLNLSPPDNKKWAGSADRRPAKAFLYRVAESARMASLCPANTWRYLLNVCLSQAHGRDLLDHLRSHNGIVMDATDKLCRAEEWFNDRWANTNTVEKTYEDLGLVRPVPGETAEDLHSRILTLKQNASFLGHAIPDTTLRKAFLAGLQPVIHDALLQVHPSPSTQLQLLVNWCTDYEQVLQSKAPTSTTASRPLCRQHLAGNCRYGDTCRFKHVQAAPATPFTSPSISPASTTAQLPASASQSSSALDSRRLEDPTLIRLCREQGVCMAFTARGACKQDAQCPYKHCSLVRNITHSPTSRDVKVLNSDLLCGYRVELDTGATHSLITDALADHLLASVPGTSEHVCSAQFDTACSPGSISSSRKLSTTLDISNGVDTFPFTWSPAIVPDSQLLHSDGLLGMDCMEFDNDGLWLRLHDVKLQAAQFLTTPSTPKESPSLSPDKVPIATIAAPANACRRVLAPTHKAALSDLVDALRLKSPTFPQPRSGWAVDSIVYENEWVRLCLFKDTNGHLEFCVDYSDQLIGIALRQPPPPVQKTHYKLATASKAARQEGRLRLDKLIEVGKLLPTTPGVENTYASNWYPVTGRKKVRPVIPQLRTNAILQEASKKFPIKDCQQKISRLINKFRTYPHYAILDVADAYRSIQLGPNAQKLAQVYIDGKHFTYSYMCDGTCTNPPLLEHVVKFILQRIQEDPLHNDTLISYMDDIIKLSGEPLLRGGTDYIISVFAQYNMHLIPSANVDDPVLGYVVSDNGTRLLYPCSKYNQSIDAQIEDSISYGTALSVLGHVTQAWDLLPWHNSLVALVSRLRAINKDKWKASINDTTVVTLLRRWQNLLRTSPLEPLQRCVNAEDELHIWFDSSDLLGAMLAIQNGNVVFRRQWRWSRSERSLHINIKEMTTAFNALSAVVAFELDSGVQFKRLCLYGDNKTANLALSSGKVSSSGKQSVLLQRVVDLVHCLMGTRQFTARYCPTADNIADAGTRCDLYADIVHHRDLLDGVELQPSISSTPSECVHVARVIRKRPHSTSLGDEPLSSSSKRPRAQLEEPIEVPLKPMTTSSTFYDIVQLPPHLMTPYRGFPRTADGKRLVEDANFILQCAHYCHSLRHAGAPEVAATLSSYLEAPDFDLTEVGKTASRSCPTCILVKTSPGDNLPKNLVDNSDALLKVPTVPFQVTSLDVLGPYHTDPATRSPRFYCVTLVCNLTNLILCYPTISAPTAADIQRACNLPHRTYSYAIQKIRTDNAAIIRSASSGMPNVEFDFVPVSASWLNGHVEARHRLLNQRLRRILLGYVFSDEKVWFDAVSKSAFEVNTSANMEAEGLCPLDMLTEKKSSPFDASEVVGLPANKWEVWAKYKADCKRRIAAVMQRKVAHGSSLQVGDTVLIHAPPHSPKSTTPWLPTKRIITEVDGNRILLDDGIWRSSDKLKKVYDELLPRYSF
ncbi:hypothetical protein FOL47_001002, partial [Perkinsus chesapeaki]